MTSRGRNVSVIFGDGAGAAVLSREIDLDRGTNRPRFILMDSMH